MRKVTIELKMQMVVVVDEAVELFDVVNGLNIMLSDPLGSADIVDTQILDFEVIGSK